MIETPSTPPDRNLDRLTTELQSLIDQSTDKDGGLPTLLDALKSATDGALAWQRHLEHAGQQLSAAVKRISREAALQHEQLDGVERRYHFVLDVLPVCIGYVDRDQRYRFVNANYQTWFGVSPDRILGQTLREFIGEEAYAKVAGYVERALAGELVEYEEEMPYKHGGPRHVRGTLVPEVNASGEVQGVFAMIDDITQRKQLEREVARAAVEQQQKLGRELHDSIGQQLTGVHMLTASLRRRLAAAGSEEAAAVAKCVELIDHVQKQLRNLARGLMPVEIETGGLALALNDLACQFDQPGSLRCEFRCDEPIEIDRNLVASYLYRIAQEAVANAARHSGATEIQIELERTAEGGLRLRVIDNGCGIDDRMLREAQRGLQIMRYRAEMIGGQFEIEKLATGGTRVTCSVPPATAADRAE